MDREGVPSEDGLFLVRLGVVLSERCRRTRSEAALAEELFAQWEGWMHQRAEGRAALLEGVAEKPAPAARIVGWGRGGRL